MTVSIKEDNKWTWWDQLKLNIETSFPVKHILRLKHYIRHILTTRCHLIRTGLPKGNWYDSDIRMLYGMMNLLTEFIEYEKPFEDIEWNSDEFHKHARDEMIAIKSWWDNYDNRKREIEDALTAWHDAKFSGCSDDNWIERLNTRDTQDIKDLSDKLHHLEADLSQEEEEMLIRLVKIRGYMWT